MQPLAKYSSYIMEESTPTGEAEPLTQEFLNVFFSLRDGNEFRYKAEASELLANGKLLTITDGITFHYQIKNREVSCTTTPDFPRKFECYFTHLSLGWRKSVNKIILVDRIAEYEARAMLNYSTQD